MKKSDINILIIDDEQALADALVRALEKAGFSAKSVKDPEEAKHEIKVKDYHLTLIDCMLPKVNGVDLAMQIQQETNGTTKIILMSGIFKDPNFKKNALQRTKAVDFIYKPFSVVDLIEMVEEHFSDIITPELPEYFKFLNEPFSVNANESINIIKDLDSIHGFELPYILSVLNKCNASCEITLSEENEDPIIIKLNNGQIYQVLSADRESYFGVLLIEHGFSSPEEVAKGLQAQSDLPIGKRLWASNKLSPHAINIVHQEQLSIRLSKAIKAVDYGFKLEPTHRKEDEELRILDNSYQRYTNDWVSSKIKVEWLKSFFAPWLQYKFEPGPNFVKAKDLKKIALVSLGPNIEDITTGDKSIDQIIEENSGKAFIFQSLYFLLLHEIIKINPETNTTTSFDVTENRLKNFIANIDGKNYYEILGVEKNSPNQKIQQAFHNLAKTLHPDKVPKNAPENIHVLTKEIFQHLNNAFKTLYSEQSREKYNFELEHGKADQIMQSENFFERGCLYLNNKKYSDAVEAFERVFEIGHYHNEFLVYYSWALIKRGGPPSQRAKLVEQVEEFLSMVPQEHRHNSNYFYVKGLYLKLTDDMEKASTAFKHAFTLNPDFKPAQLEWLSIEHSQVKDTPSLFGNLFKKKSS